MKPYASIACVIVALILSGPAWTTTIYVDDDAPNDPGHGDPTVSDPLEDGTADHPYDAIQEGIDAAVGGVDDVLVKDGTYTGIGNRDIDFGGKAITLVSDNGAASTIIDCEGTNLEPHRGFYFHSGETATSVVDGFTITNGGGVESGGGVYCDGSSPTITNCAITGNNGGVVDHGGGFYCHGSSPMITNCAITGNSSVWYSGGGIFCSDSSAPTITNCTITGNSAGYAGGGIYCHWLSHAAIANCTIRGNTTDTVGGGIYSRSFSSPAITNCTISDNDAFFNGGGIYCEYDSNPTITNCAITGNSAGDYGGGIGCADSADPTITNCTITGNSAGHYGGSIEGGDGGGIYCLSSYPAITNCTISANRAVEGYFGGYGGGVACYESSPTITNCTVTGNMADYQGGGIDCHQTCSPTMTNCILWGNTAPDGHEIALTSTAYPSTLTVRYGDVQGGEGEAYVEAGCTLDMDGTNIGDDPGDDPLFVVGPLHDYYLSQIAAGHAADSPCVDAGSDTAANLGLDALTTRTDAVSDTGMVDMGYHAPPAIFGDVDGNGVVDGLDLTAVITAWQTTPGDPLWNPAADLDGNGIVDGLDLTEVISNWTSAGATAPAAAAEPSAAEIMKTTSPGRRRGNMRRDSESGNVRRK